MLFLGEKNVIQQETDKNLIQNLDNMFTIYQVYDHYLLRRIHIQKKPLLYSHIGGMWYTTNSFTLKQKSPYNLVQLKILCMNRYTSANGLPPEFGYLF